MKKQKILFTISNNPFFPDTTENIRYIILIKESSYCRCTLVDIFKDIRNWL